MNISPLASVHPKSSLHDRVIIEPFAHIHEDVVIGEGTKIHSNAVLYPGTRIGKNCEVFPGAVIGVIPQDLKFGGEYTLVEIGDHTVIRECVTIHRGTNDKLSTKIGSHCLLMTYVHVAHDCTIGNHVILASYTGLSGHVQIDDYAILEGKVAAQQFTHIGKHTFIGGASLIRKNIPPYVKAAREPLTFAGVNSVGLRRRGYSDDTIREIEDLYRILYIQNSNISKGIEAIKSQIPDSEIRTEILNFISSSDKGVIRGMI
ncbi:MAG: acyl-ACP--UDP-N-acetylglucosamine O-acyltransferase [Crocinitomicaceae bacterium]|jgi:UDP-N-acetylglucosamine acyltransferase|nr:acyl-ACP--UDP-N-acetylglucosamine O-acyltransferase [Crocinitomicaceae bacterium]MDG1350157.1 acyl-ACP--UDP-N-acetylglucosamine O-acyltransferase [Crocinitomicaceae bacterium]MDG1734847.1 acyl-ACP--UDP-N-acetylglucosamine O-acyltransferase [Crocinitomicaceae bacterium]MDG2506043.1 acyl-ACP--UDP-N-acetylglucosamine O-acyltransferase [Crocinitomicaceae bacterium]